MTWAIQNWHLVEPLSKNGSSQKQIPEVAVVGTRPRSLSGAHDKHSRGSLRVEQDSGERVPRQIATFVECSPYLPRFDNCCSSSRWLGGRKEVDEFFAYSQKNLEGSPQRHCHQLALRPHTCITGSDKSIKSGCDVGPRIVNICLPTSLLTLNQNKMYDGREAPGNQTVTRDRGSSTYHSARIIAPLILNSM